MLRKIQPDIIILHRSSSKLQTILIKCWSNSIFSTHFQKCFEYKFQKFCPVAATLFLANWECYRLTDMTKLRFALPNCGTHLKMKIWQKYKSICENYLPTALHQAAKSMNCMHISTGILSSCAFGSASIVRENPLPLATMVPIGPLKLSVHPGKGSFQAEVTAWNRWKLSESFCRYNRSVLAVLHNKTGNVRIT
jgi:hypothetical protein